MMGPPDEATLDEWREAFVRENRLRMALEAKLAALEAELRRPEVALPPPLSPTRLIELTKQYIADRIAALRQEPQP